MLREEIVDRIEGRRSVPLRDLSMGIVSCLLLLTTGCREKQVFQGDALLKIVGTESSDSLEIEGSVRTAPNGEKFRLIRLKVASGATSRQPLPGNWPTSPYLTDSPGARFNLVGQWYKVGPGYTAERTQDGRFTYSDSIETTLAFGPTPEKSAKFLFHAHSNDPITVRF